VIFHPYKDIKHKKYKKHKRKGSDRRKGGKMAEMTVKVKEGKGSVAQQP